MGRLGVDWTDYHTDSNRASVVMTASALLTEEALRLEVKIARHAWVDWQALVPAGAVLSQASGLGLE